MRAPWLQLKRMIGLDPDPFPLTAQEGQLRYVRSGSVDGTVYLARRTSAGTMEWNPLTDQMQIANASQDSADTASTADTGIYSTALTTSIALPEGTWNVKAQGWLSMIHSASLKATFRVKVDGTAGSAMTTQNLSATLYTMWTDAGAKNGVAGAQTIDVVLEYHSSGAGTTSASNCGLWITATRTA